MILRRSLEVSPSLSQESHHCRRVSEAGSRVERAPAILSADVRRRSILKKIDHNLLGFGSGGKRSFSKHCTSFSYAINSRIFVINFMFCFVYPRIFHFFETLSEFYIESYTKLETKFHKDLTNIQFI